MKQAIYFTLLLVTLVLLHDTVYAERNHVPFSLTDFGWMIQQYVPYVETFLIDNLSQEFRSRYLGQIFNTKALFVAFGIGGLFILLMVVRNIRAGKSIVREIPIISWFSREKSSKNSRTKGRFKYKSKD